MQKFYFHPADRAKKSETSTKLRFKFSRSHFSLLMKQEIINTGYIHKAFALLLNPIDLPKDLNFFNPNPPFSQKVVLPQLFILCPIN